MSQVSISELKARLSRYLREVRRGGEVEVLDRGVPVARISGLKGRPADPERRRERLVAAGILRPGEGGVAKVLRRRPLDLGTSLVEALAADREDRF